MDVLRRGEELDEHQLGSSGQPVGSMTLASTLTVLRRAAVTKHHDLERVGSPPGTIGLVLRLTSVQRSSHCAASPRTGVLTWTAPHHRSYTVAPDRYRYQMRALILCSSPRAIKFSWSR